MAYIIVITSLHPTELRPLLQYDDNNGVSLSPSHFFFLLHFFFGGGGGNFSLPTTLGAKR